MFVRVAIFIVAVAFARAHTTPPAAANHSDHGAAHTKLTTTKSVATTPGPGVSVQGTPGGWNSWMTWTTCSVTCGMGYHVRSRICDSPPPSGGGLDCEESDYDTKPCDEIHCPVDGEWNTWEAWRGCTTTCGTGVTYRTRKCDNPEPAYNGAACIGSSQEFSKCALNSCPVDGHYTNWGEWASCSQTCGYNVYRPRFRNCTNPPPMYGGADCLGDSMDQQLCDYIDCKDGTWNEWAPWGDCSATCGTSVHFRFRNCSFSANNGSCVGDEYESGLCSSYCPVDGAWSFWGDWASCSASCENGTTMRARTCSNPTPAHNGKNCTGISSESKTCTVPVQCPIDGAWTSWTSWTKCDQTCAGGHQIRIRRCSNPPPQFNGASCPGTDIETQLCNIDPCPVDGSWGTWFPWSPCSSTCGSGTMTRFRTCSNPKPQYGGAFCDGEFEESTSCSINPDVTNCTIDGGWSGWGSWGSCAVSCGDGVVTRTRLCDNPRPHGEGKFCAGSTNDTKPCQSGTHCPIDGEWGEWRSWFPCTATCGTSTQTRFRTCSNPKPQYGGNYCAGDPDQNQDCLLGACADGGDPAIVG